MLQKEYEAKQEGLVEWRKSGDCGQGIIVLSVGMKLKYLQHQTRTGLDMTVILLDV